MPTDIVEPTESELRYPFLEPPASGELIEAHPGILWMRIPLPYQLNHVNIYLLRDGDGWVIVDTGISTEEAKDVWERYLSGPLAGMKITRILVTHFHPDHIGLAGWLCERFRAPLLTSLSSYMSCRVISLDPRAFESPRNRIFYKSHGMADDAADIVSTQGQEYLQQVDALPDTFLRLVMGDTLTIGGRMFRVVTGDGHVAEQVMLYCEAENILLAADQVLEHISPNVSVWAGEPDGDPLGHYLRSLRFLVDELPEGVLVLPGHMRPFYGLHARSRQLIAHHEARCGMILDACRDQHRSVAELVPLLFHRPLNPHQMGFAFAETLAHANRLVRRGELDMSSQRERFLFRIGQSR